MTDFFDDAREELERANQKHRPYFASLHEGFAVLKEEVDELWDIVKAQDGDRDRAHFLKECRQVAAMAGKLAAMAEVDEAPDVQHIPWGSEVVQ